MKVTFSAELAYFLTLLIGVQVVLGVRNKVVAEEISNNSNDCWQEVESILLNSSHQYTACMFSGICVIYISLKIAIFQIKSN